MKKLIISLLLCVILMTCLVGCESGTVTEDYDVDMNSIYPLQLVKKIEDNSMSGVAISEIYYYTDIQTQVMYMYIIDWNGNATRGGFCPLYNADGTIMTYEQFQEIYTN